MDRLSSWTDPPPGQVNLKDRAAFWTGQPLGSRQVSLPERSTFWTGLPPGQVSLLERSAEEVSREIAAEFQGREKGEGEWSATIHWSRGGLGMVWE